MQYNCNHLCKGEINPHKQVWRQTVISGDYSQVVMAVPRGKEGESKGLLPRVKA